MLARTGGSSRWWGLLAVAGVGAVLAAGCGGATTRQPSAPSRATAASNHRLARVEARHLLSLVRVPPGSRPAASPGSRQLASVLNGTLTGAMEARRYWRVDEPYDRAIAWIDAHAPAGSRSAGSTTTSKGVVTSMVGGFVFFPPSTAAWQNAQLSVEATATGPDVTAVRADAQVQWTDPTPYRDTVTGRRLHVPAAGPCPSTSMRYVDVTNSGAGLQTSLLSPGRVTGALVCRYGEPAPVAHPDERLTLSRRLGPRATAYLAVRARRVALGHPTAQPPAACADVADPMRVIVAFRYADGRTEDLWIEPTACPALEDNGSIKVILDGSLYQAIQRTVPGVARNP